MSILQKIKQGFVFFDGGMGTELQKRGMQPGEMPELWNITHPEIVTEIHREYYNAGADIVTFHIEASEDCGKLIDTITELGAKPSLSIKPNTPAEAVFPYLDKLYMFLVMTVEPGFGGQKMITECLDKVKTIKAEISRRGLKTVVQADGGINDETLAMTVESGVDVAVLGSAVFAQNDRNSYIEKIQKM